MVTAAIWSWSQHGMLIKMKVPADAPDAHDVARLPGRQGGCALRHHAAEGLLVLAPRQATYGVAWRLSRD